MLTIAVMLTGCREGDDEAPAAQAIVAAESVVIVAQPFTDVIDGAGTVVARPGHSAALGVPIAARVLQVLVVAGQQVKAGDALIELDRASIDAEAASAEAELLSAEAAADRANRLVAAGVIPRREAEQATAVAAHARANAATARRTAALATLRAPLSGTVTRVSANVGESADPSRTLIEIANTDTIDVLLTLSARDVSAVHVGMPVSLHSDGDTVGTGTVVDVGAAIDSLTRGVAVRVRVAATSRRLRLGETISGSITLATTPNAITVPLAALVPTGEAFQVFVVDSAGVVHAREVTVSGKDAARAHISAGLAAGERVVTTGAYGMDEGATIAPARPPR